MAPSEDLDPEVESSLEPASPPLSACASESPVPIAPTVQPEELLNGAPSPPAVDLSPVSEPEEQAREVSSMAPATILCATPPVAPSETSAQEEEIEEEEGGEAESEKGAEDLPLDSTPVPAQLSQNLEVAAATQGKV